MKELSRNEAIGNICVVPGDILVAFVEDESGRRELGRHEITREFVVDTLVIVELGPGELGLSCGFGTIFGGRDR